MVVKDQRLAHKTREPRSGSTDIRQTPVSMEAGSSRTFSPSMKSQDLHRIAKEGGCAEARCTPCASDNRRALLNILIIFHRKPSLIKDFSQRSDAGKQTLVA
jgi:hypothetical protein